MEEEIFSQFRMVPYIHIIRRKLDILARSEYLTVVMIPYQDLIHIHVRYTKLNILGL